MVPQGVRGHYVRWGWRNRVSRWTPGLAKVKLVKGRTGLQTRACLQHLWSSQHSVLHLIFS